MLVTRATEKMTLPRRKRSAIVGLLVGLSCKRLDRRLRPQVPGTEGRDNDRCTSAPPDFDRRESFPPAKREGWRSHFDRRQLLADPVLPGRAGACALSQERADARPLAHLFRQ